MYGADNKTQDFFSEPEGQAKPQSDVTQIGGGLHQDMSRNELVASPSTTVGDTVSRRPSSKPIADPEVEPPVQDAGAGKVRGPNGRYLPRDDINPGSKKTKKPKKGFQSRKSMRNAEKIESSVPKAISGEPEAAPAEDEDFSAGVQSSSPPALGQEAEEQNGVEEEANMLPVTSIVVPPATDAVARSTTIHEPEVREEEAASDPGPVPAYLLAAEADAVLSNLDRLPPNSRKSNKRKSEPVVQSGDRKRGKHGGIVGRPRKSEQCRGQNSHQEPVPPQKEAALDAGEAPQMTTRRATRQAAAAKPQTDVPVEQHTYISKGSPMLTSNPGEQSARDEDEVMGGVGDDAPATHEKSFAPTPDAMEVHATPSSTLEGFSLPPQTSNNHLLSVGLDMTRPFALPQPGSRPQPYQSPYQPIPSPPPSASVAKEAMNNGAVSVYLPGHVEYFARIRTGNGDTMDLTIEEDQLESNEVKMIRKYAKYNAEPGVVPVSYAQFRQIFAFAKQD